MRQAELASDGVCLCAPLCAYLKGREVICLLHALTWPHAAMSTSEYVHLLIKWAHGVLTGTFTLLGKKKRFFCLPCASQPQKIYIFCFFFLLVCLFFAIKTLNQCQIQSSYINNPQRSLLNCIEFDIIQKTADILCQHSSFKGSHSPSTFS